MIYNSSLKAAVFLGPSLDAQTAGTILPANYYPPVKLGDIYALSATDVQIIVIIDGLFWATTPVWQREILDAIDNAKTVIGCSSMGALRASELYPFGMIGVGKIFEWYRDGVIEGDDEVALLHAGPEVGYISASEPMVNIRYNLDSAVSAGVIDDSDASAIKEYMKNLCFSERRMEMLVDIPAFKEMPESRRNSLKKYLLEKSIDLKKNDAVMGLQKAAEFMQHNNSRGQDINSCRSNLCDNSSEIETSAGDRAIIKTTYDRKIENVNAIRMRCASIPLKEEMEYSLMSLGKMLEKFMDNHDLNSVALELKRDYYLLKWMVWKGIKYDVNENISKCSGTDMKNPMDDKWLMMRGISAEEFKQEEHRREVAEWLINMEEYGSWEKRIYDWAESEGIGWPDFEDDDGNDSSLENADSDFVTRRIEWLINQDTVQMGYDTWPLEYGLIRHMQLSDDFTQFVEDLSRELLASD